MKERDLQLDLVRVFSCIMIICMHAPMPTEKAISYFNLAICYLTIPGLCLFFIISGTLLLPVKIDTRTFLKHRLGKVVVPTLFFSVFYIILNIIIGEQKDIIKSVCSIPFSAQGSGVLWFMYTLTGLYILAPILSRWLVNASQREIEFYLLLWGITLCYPLLNLILDINETQIGILYYYSGFVGYFVLGYYLKKFPKAISLKKIIIPTSVSIIVPVLCKLNHITPPNSIFGYFSIFILILCVFYYKIFDLLYIKHLRYCGNKIKSYLILTSNLSFGIYLVHIAIMRFFLWKSIFIISINNYIVQWGVIVIITFAASWIMTYMISLLPYGNYIVGYKTNKQTK